MRQARRKPGRKGGRNSTTGGRGGGNRDPLGDRSRAHYENILQYSVIFAIEKDRASEKSAKMHRMENTTKSKGANTPVKHGSSTSTSERKILQNPKTRFFCLFNLT